MSIRPVDLQVMLPKSSEVSQIHNNVNNRPETQQQLFAQHLQKQVEHNQQQVIGTNKSEKQNVDKDGSNKNRQDLKKRKEDETKEKEAAKKNSPYENRGMVDISI